MITREISLDAQRNILVGWGQLSLGDVSTIEANIQSGGAVMTTRTCPHGDFWTQVVRLEWAIEQELPSQLSSLVPDNVCFRLTQQGREKLAQFINYWKLFDLSVHNHAPVDQKPPIAFTGRDGVFVLLDRDKYPLNFVAMPTSPGFDEIASAMMKRGRTISRFDPGHQPA